MSASNSIAENILSVSAHMDKTVTRFQRREGSVKLLAVSKTFSADAVREALAAGQTGFGENYVQEALDKMSALADLRERLEWHLIGPLQSNKTRVVAERFDWVHSVDRLKRAGVRDAAR